MKSLYFPKLNIKLTLLQHLWQKTALGGSDIFFHAVWIAVSCHFHMKLILHTGATGLRGENEDVRRLKGFNSPQRDFAKMEVGFHLPSTAPLVGNFRECTQREIHSTSGSEKLK